MARPTRDVGKICMEPAYDSFPDGWIFDRGRSYHDIRWSEQYV